MRRGNATGCPSSVVTEGRGVVRRDRGGYRIPESPFSDTYQIPSDPSRPIGLVSPIPDATHLTPSCPEHEPAERDDDPESRDWHGDRADTARREECPADETEQHDVPNFERPACHQADQDENWRVEYEPERGFTVEVRDDPALKELRVDGVHETVPRDVGQRLVKDRDAHEGVTESGRDEE